MPLENVLFFWRHSAASFLSPLGAFWKQEIGCPTLESAGTGILAVHTRPTRAVCSSVVYIYIWPRAHGLRWSEGNAVRFEASLRFPDITPQDREFVEPQILIRPILGRSH